MSRNILWLLAGGIVYYLYKKEKVSGKSALDGLGIGGAPRRGKPKTDEERRSSHTARYGNGDLPPRGTGLRGRR